MMLQPNARGNKFISTNLPDKADWINPTKPVMMKALAPICME